MAVNTARRRASALGVGLAFTLLIIPDSAITQPDRQTIGLSYSGIEAAVPVIDTPDCFVPLSSLIGNEAQGLTGVIDDTEIAESGIILEFNAFQGAIDSSIIALQGAIDPDGEALNSNIQDSFGINAELCDC